MQSDNYQKIKVLGEGTYGKCYLVRHKATEEILVLKQIEIMGMTDTEIQESLREVQILQSLDHPYIITFRGSFQTKQGYLNILMNYADGGDLNQKIKQARQRQQVLPQSQILDWFTQVCLAIKHVHKQKIIHRDIKSQNIFLTKEGRVKLGDFGIARPLQLTLQKIKSVVGTPYYMSPEICQNKEYSLKTDIWSLGVLLLEMCLRKQPFDAQSLPALALKILKGQYTPIPKVYSRQLKKLVSDMMQLDPAKRPNIDQVLKSPLTIHRVDQFLPKEIRDRQFSGHSIGEANMNKGGLGAASKGLFIKCGWQDSSSQPIYSPKNYVSNKNYDFPVKRIDNYTKEINNKNLQKGDKKANKKSELKKKESSEPTLTPKGHTKIQNQRKVMAKNSSVANFQKKSGVQNVGLFKKKSKHSPDMIGGFSQINQIQEMKKDIESLIRGQISIRTKEIDPLEIEEFEESTKQNEMKMIQEEKQTLLQTLELIIQESEGIQDLSQLYNQCSKQGGVHMYGKNAGLITLAYYMHLQKVE